LEARHRFDSHIADVFFSPHNQCERHVEPCTRRGRSTASSPRFDYCADNGRPALAPVVLFKLLLVGYRFGIRSDGQLMREVQVPWIRRMIVSLFRMGERQTRAFRLACS
jgi:hypothetical protein